ncbi:MAG TPA: hypothetical protein VIM37_01725 [Candidatus Microsaccharimonas sp.]|jgi:hypothetical protein
MIKGYITLKQASELSGKETEALKKQCQDGRIRGAIKQGKTWFVPQSEIVVNDTNIGNGTLYYLISLIESTKGNDESTASFGVTFIINGSIIQGELIPRQEYLRHFRENMLTKITFKSETIDSGFEAKFREFTNRYFDDLVEKDEDGIPSFIHLRKISSHQLNNGAATEGSYIRIKTDSIDGFMLGTANN